MALVFGIVSGFILLIGSGLQIWNVISSIIPGGSVLMDTCMTEGHLYCAGEFLSLALIPTLFYWYGLIQQYDEDILKKREQLEALQEESQQLFSDTIKEMEGMLENQAENNAGLAEKSFDGKKRDFLRFVRAAKTKYKNYFTGSKAETVQLANEFRQFVKNWLVVFEEASVDPINNPLQLGGENQSEVDSLETLDAIAEWVEAKLKVTTVNFISDQMQTDKQLIANSKAEEGRRKHKQLMGRNGYLMVKDHVGQSSILRICFDEWRSIAAQAQRVREGGNARDVALLEAGEYGFGRRLSLQEDEVEQRKEPCLGCTWYKCSRVKLELNLAEDGSSFPYVAYIGFASIIFFSKDHTYLVGAFFACTGGFITQFFQPEISLANLVLFAIVVVSIFMVLLRFEFIDEVLRLESEVNDLKQRTGALEEKQKRMAVFWADVQNLADLWLHRTVPRLEVIKEAHSHLEDAKPEDILNLLSQTNQALKQLEASVGPRHLWLKDGGITEADKKRFGEGIHALADNKDLPAVIAGLQQANLAIGDASRRASLQSLVDIKAIQQENNYILG